MKDDLQGKKLKLAQACFVSGTNESKQSLRTALSNSSISLSDANKIAVSNLWRQRRILQLWKVISAELHNSHKSDVTRMWGCVHEIAKSIVSRSSEVKAKAGLSISKHYCSKSRTFSIQS